MLPGRRPRGRPIFMCSIRPPTTRSRAHESLGLRSPTMHFAHFLLMTFRSPESRTYASSTNSNESSSPLNIAMKSEDALELSPTFCSGGETALYRRSQRGAGTAVDHAELGPRGPGSWLRGIPTGGRRAALLSKGKSECSASRDLLPRHTARNPHRPHLVSVHSPIPRPRITNGPTTWFSRSSLSG